MKNILTSFRSILLIVPIYFALMPASAFATILTLNYTFTSAVAGTSVTVTWTTDNPSDIVNVSLIRLSIFTSVQTINGLPNSGSAAFLIDNSHPPGAYQFYLENDPLTFWNYGPEFNLLPPAACCQDQAAFLANVAQGFTAIQQKCGIALQPNALDDCQRVSYTWGDGSTTGPLVGNAATSHIYPGSGFYQVCAKIEEVSAAGAVCFAHDTCWNICAVCDTCKNPMIKDEWTTAPYEWEDYNTSHSQFDMYADAQGDFYVTGNRTVPGNDQDGFVEKYTSGGALAWSFSFGGLSADKGSLISRNPLDNGFYLGGNFRSDSFDLPSFGSSNAVRLRLRGTNPLQDDNFLARYGTNRNLEWAFELGDVWDDDINGMAVDGNGNVYVSGATRAAVDFNPLGPPRVLNLPVNCPFVAKYNPDGQLQWVRYLYDATQMNCGTHLGLALDADANVYVCGEFYGTPHWEGWPAVNLLSNLTITTNISSLIGTGAPYLAKFKSNGDFDWAFDLQNTAKDKHGSIWDVEVQDQYLYITGRVAENTPIQFAPRGGVSILTPPLTNGNFVARYNRLDGQAEKGVELPALQYIDELEIGTTGNVYAAGYSGGTNNPAMLVHIFDAGLALKKSLQTGSGGNPKDIASAIAPDPFGDFGIAGKIGSQQFDADPQTADGFEETFTDGHQHVFIGKYTCDCPGDLVSPCGPCDSISAALVHKPSAEGCCAAIKIHNRLPAYFAAVQVSVISGGSLFIGDVTPRPGWQLGAYANGSSFTLVPAGGGFVPAGTLDFAFICMSNLTAADQYLAVQYLGANGDTLCRDTLHFTCNFCLGIVSESITCERTGLWKMTFCVEINPDLGWNANALVLMPKAGVSVSPASFSLPDVPPGTQYCTLTTYITAAPGTDTACIGFTVHEQNVTLGLPPLRCCMIDACFTLPGCPCDPDVTYATLTAGQFGDNTCCQDIALHQLPGTISSVQTNLLTPGVSFNAVAPSSAWDFAIASGQSLLWTPDASGTLPAAIALPTLCLDVPVGSASPQVLEIVWVAIDGDTCRQRLEFNCAAGDPCATVDSVQLVCGQPLPANNLYTIAVTNHSPYVVSHVGVAYESPAGSVLNDVFNVGALAPGATTNITLPLVGGPAGTNVCFRLNLYRETGPNTYAECCVTEIEHCVAIKFCGMPSGPQLVALYPNPARGRFTLDFGAAGSRASMQARVRDIAGKGVHQEDLPVGSTRHTMEIPGLAPGLYLVELVENGLRAWVRKVSVVR